MNAIVQIPQLTCRTWGHKAQHDLMVSTCVNKAAGIFVIEC